ncbi:hypothetical protein CVS37_19060 [Burkholderia lata]|nr:hypothetical protein CVS37_19060 [Burkholderia lata]
MRSLTIGHRTPDTGHRTPDTGHRTPDAGRHGNSAHPSSAGCRARNAHLPLFPRSIRRQGCTCRHPSARQVPSDKFV